MGAGKSRKSTRDLQSVPAPSSTEYILVFGTNVYISGKKSADFPLQPKGNQSIFQGPYKSRPKTSETFAETFATGFGKP
eukprot:SAG11_NODE_22296_length_407_cov_1.443366_1_plen_79_part_00